LLWLRYLFGIAGAALVDGAVASGATRTTAAQITAYLDNIRPLLDADGNGAVDALTDGVLVVRDLFGLTGTALTDDAIGPGATRTTPSGPTAEPCIEVNPKKR